MKYFTILISVLFAGTLSAQSFYIDAGIKAQTGATSLLNQAVSDHPLWTYDISTGFSFGGKVGFNFEDHGITVDVLFGQAESSFENDGGVGPNLITEWSSTDLYLLYRLSRYRGYLEIGPKASFIRNVDNRNADGTTSDFASFYEDQVYSGVLGFGTYLIGTDGRFSGIFGLRFEYGITDMLTQADGEPIGLPVLQDGLYDNGYTQTVPFFAGIVFEMNWGIGYYGKASCGARGKFIFL